MDQTVHLSKLYRAVTRRLKLGKGKKRKSSRQGEPVYRLRKQFKQQILRTVLGKNGRIFQAHVKSLNLPLESTGRRKVLRELTQEARELVCSNTCSFPGQVCSASAAFQEFLTRGSADCSACSQKYLEMTASHTGIEEQGGLQCAAVVKSVSLGLSAVPVSQGPLWNLAS